MLVNFTNRRMRHIIYYFCMIIFVISCKRIEKKELKRISILDYFDIDTSWNYINDKFHTCFEDSLDSYLEIRFSTWGTFLQPNRYLILKYNGSEWKGTIGLNPLIVGEKSFIKEIDPKIGWNSFEDSLISIDVNSLVSRDYIKDSLENRIIDGESLYMEIITPTQYKIYHYHEPEILFISKKKSKSLIKFERLFTLINSNFDNYYMRKSFN
jgi:hypothetical protein